MMEHCLKNLQTELEELCEVLRHSADMAITSDDRKSFIQAVQCDVCGEVLNQDRVRDHCHIRESIVDQPTTHATSSCGYIQKRLRFLWSSTTFEAMMAT